MFIHTYDSQSLSNTDKWKHILTDTQNIHINMKHTIKNTLTWEDIVRNTLVNKAFNSKPCPFQYKYSQRLTWNNTLTNILEIHSHKHTYKWVNTLKPHTHTKLLLKHAHLHTAYIHKHDHTGTGTHIQWITCVLKHKNTTLPQ